MGYPKEITNRAFDILESRRNRARNEFYARITEIEQKLPQVIELDRELTRTSAEIAKAILTGVNVEEKLDRLRDNNLYMQGRRNELLRAAGYPENYTQLIFECPDCSDTGYTQNGICQCMKAIQRELMLRRLSDSASIGSCTFASFSLDYYSAESLPGRSISPRSIMTQALALCKNYADSFDPKSSPSLLFQGATGLGKTHLSLAIAQRVIEGGFDVLYSPVQNLLSRLEKERFRGAEGDSIDFVLDCDLLILDDLGAEFSTSFSVSVVYNIINSRLIENKPTIINTNLSMQEIEDRYSPRIVSRLVGGYNTVPFYGVDIRMQKNR